MVTGIFAWFRLATSSCFPSAINKHTVDQQDCERSLRLPRASGVFRRPTRRDSDGGAFAAAVEVLIAGFVFPSGFDEIGRIVRLMLL